ncbi:MAG: hypothetical protein AB7S81_04480 [Bdellovibrionales bacterium]
MSISEEFVKALNLDLYNDVVQLSLGLELDPFKTETCYGVGAPLLSLFSLMNEINREGIRVGCTIYQPTALLAFAQKMPFGRAKDVAARAANTVFDVAAKTCPSKLLKLIEIVTGDACSLLPAGLLRDSRKLITQNSDIKPCLVSAGKFILNRGVQGCYPLLNYTPREVTKFVPFCSEQDLPVVELAGKLSRERGAFYEIVPFVLDKDGGCENLPQRPSFVRADTNQGETYTLAS